MSKFLSLDWFKSKVEQSVDRVIEKRINSLIEEEQEGFEIKKVLLVNDNLTIMLNDGQMFHKSGATEEEYHAVSNASSIEEIETVIGNIKGKEDRVKEKAEQKRLKAVKEGFNILKTMSTFKIKDNKLYLRGIKRTIPPLLAEKFVEIVYKVQESNKDSRETLDALCNKDEEFLSFKRFFMWCCLNPRAEVAKELYRFLNENSFRITKQGFFVALRNVVSLEANNGSNEKVKFVSNAYNKIKAVWKKKPKEYVVYQTINGGYSFTKSSTVSTPKFQNAHHTVVGNLEDLYLDLPNMSENRFTDDWTKTFDIRVGQVVEMPKEKCNWSTQDCAAAGLHFTADQIHYVGCGDTSMLILINPMKVVGIGTHKGRCYEYLPIMTVPRDEATQILHDGDFDTLEIEEQYALEQLKNLKSIVKEGFAKESEKEQFNLSPISSSELNILVEDLKEMKKELQKRVVNID